MTSQIQKAVNAVKTIVEQEEEKLKEKTGIEVNFTEDKVQDYMQQVVEEMLKHKSVSKIDHNMFLQNLLLTILYDLLHKDLIRFLTYS